MQSITKGVDALLEKPVASFLFLFGFWLAAIGYDGLRHDNILYAAQAYQRLFPAIFKLDVFFGSGSQDDYSVFGSLFAELIKWIGLGQANLLCVLALQSLLFVATYALFLQCFNKRVAFLAIVLLGALPRVYGPFLSLYENFLTARPFAELCVILGLTLLLRGRLIVSLLVMLMGFLFHPLQTLPGVAVFFLFKLFGSDYKWRWIGGFVAIAIAVLWLVVKGIGPFALLLLRYDDAWLEVIQDTNFVLLLRWHLAEWVPLLFDIVVIMALFRHGRARSTMPVMMLTAAAAVVAACGYLIALVFGDLIHNVLVVSLQLWRMQWIMHLLAFGLLAQLLVAHWRSPGPVRVSLLLIVLGIASQRYLGGALALALAGILILSTPALSVAFERLCLALSALGIFAVFAIQYRIFFTAADQLNFANSARTYLSPTQVVLFLSLCLLMVASRLHKSRAIYCVVGLQLFIGGYLWDKRDEWHRIVESPQLENPLVLALKDDGQVYWPNQLLAVWFLLQRPSYYVEQQGSGVLFNRATAMEFKRHQDGVKAIEFQSQICSMLNAFNNDRACHADVQAYVELCRSDETLSYFVTDSPLGVEAKAVWNPQVSGRQESWYLYSCKTLI